jgi:hypothetical protein
LQGTRNPLLRALLLLLCFSLLSATRLSYSTSIAQVL